MKLINKSDLSYKEGYLLDAEGTVHNYVHLVSEVNELTEMAELVEFVTENKTAILAAAGGDPIKFKPTKHVAAKIVSGIEVSTPVTDEEKAKKQAIAEEFLQVQDAKDIDRQLERYGALAQFMADDYVVSENYGVDGPRFKADPFSFTEQGVIDLVVAYRNPEVQKLIKLVEIDFS